MEFGKDSFCACAPSNSGGSLTNCSSSFGNLNPLSLKARPKSLGSGQLLWHVAQAVRYFREKAGIAIKRGAELCNTMRAATARKICLEMSSLRIRFIVAHTFSDAMES